jgi:hypothetical protein
MCVTFYVCEITKTCYHKISHFVLQKSPVYLITNVSNTSNQCYKIGSQMCPLRVLILVAPVVEEHSASTFRVRDAAVST